MRKTLLFALFLVFRLIMAGQVCGECLDGWVNVLKSEDSIAIVRNHQVGAGLGWGSHWCCPYLLLLLSLLCLVNCHRARVKILVDWRSSSINLLIFYWKNHRTSCVLELQQILSSFSISSILNKRSEKWEVNMIHVKFHGSCARSWTINILSSSRRDR